MCGIVGVLSQHQAAPLLVDALKKLEYRGYDSAGIAVINNGTIKSKRALGKLIELNDILVYEPLIGKSGIGHTRWATHGAPSVKNAHPHSTGKVSVVHNGIIENYKELKAELCNLGYKFKSETDTETIVALCSHYLESGCSKKEAAVKTISRLKGAFAFCLLFEGEEDLLIAARKGSPLAIGHGDKEMFVGSDAIALSAMTNKITYLEEGDYAFITRTSIEIFNAKNIITQRKIEKIDLETTNLGKAGHNHFMSKEIAEQPTVLRNAISHYLNQAESTVNLKETNLNFEDVDRIVMIACGTAFYACQVAKYWMEKISNIPVEIDIASEFRYREPPISNKTLAIFVSQSGETADTLAALRYCKEKTKKILSIVNVPTSSISRESTISLPIMAGTEIGVASTKAFTSQLLTLAILCISAGIDKKFLKKEEQAKLVQDLIKLPNLITTALLQESEITKIAKKISLSADVLFMGRGALYPIALEGALKLKEISYIHAEGYASGELKHGPIALIDENIPVIVFAPFDALFDKTISNMQEVLARDGQVVLITDAEGSKIVGHDVKDKIIMPSFDSIFAPIIYAIPAQLLAYHAAIAKGTDVDQPRNLAKSVTVE